MIKLSIQRKIEIYKDALAYYMECVEDGNPYGLCRAINVARKYNEPTPYRYDEMKIAYPELFAFYPPDKDFGKEYWWDINDTKFRIDILTNIIKELEGK